MYARPRFFAKVMGELLFWVGEDKMLFGSDYGIWEPKWQIEMFLDWDYPDEEYSDYPRVNEDTKRKILGLNAAKLYGIEVPEGFDIAGAGSRGRCAVGGGVGLSMSGQASTAPGGQQPDDWHLGLCNRRGRGSSGRRPARAGPRRARPGL